MEEDCTQPLLNTVKDNNEPQPEPYTSSNTHRRIAPLESAEKYNSIGSRGESSSQDSDINLVGGNQHERNLDSFLLVNERNPDVRRPLNVDCVKNNDNCNLATDGEDGKVAESQSGISSIEEPGIQQSAVSDELPSTSRKFSQHNDSLIIAVMENNLTEVKRLLALGADPDAMCQANCLSVSHLAAFRDYVNVLNALILAGARVDGGGSAGVTPLHLAAWSGSRACASQLKFYQDGKNILSFVNAISDITAPPVSGENNIIQFEPAWLGRSALQLAAARMHPEMCRLLLQVGALHMTSPSALDVCATASTDLQHLQGFENRFLETVNVLVENGQQNPSHQTDRLDIKVTTSFHVAVQLDCTKVIERLMMLGVEPTCQDQHERTPLQLALLRPTCSSLMAMLNFRDPHSNQTSADLVVIALAAAVEHNTRAFAVILNNYNLDEMIRINERADPNLVNPLFKAIELGSKSAVTELLSRGPRLVDSISGETVYHRAVSHPDILQLLLERKDNIFNEEDATGITPLQLAVMRNCQKSVEQLLDIGANPRHVSSVGDHRTAVHLAIKEDLPLMVETLLQRDAAVSEDLDRNGLSPFHSAIVSGHRQIVKIFLSKNGRLTETIADQSTPPVNVCTAELIMKNVPRPSDLLVEVFDSYISLEPSSTNRERSQIKIDYSILLPPVKGNYYGEKKGQQMKVVDTLLCLGDNRHKMNVLTHRLVESFLHLKWEKMKIFFYVLLLLYVILAASFTCDVYARYTWPDNARRKPLAVFFVVLAVISLIEGLNWRVRGFSTVVNFKDNWRGMLNGLGIILAVAVIAVPTDSPLARELAAGVLLLVWLEVVVLLSRFPNCGYFYQMFYVVTFRVIKVMFLFLLPIVLGFSIAFWLMFYAEKPFNTPWNSMLKIIVMMMSEFDFGDTFEDNSSIVSQVLFIAFVIMIPVVTMNLLVALAVSDTNDLKMEGRLQRLLAQVALLSSLEALCSEHASALLHRFIVPSEISVHMDDCRGWGRRILPDKMVNSFAKALDVVNKKTREEEYQAFIRESFSDLIMKMSKLDENMNRLDKKLERVLAK